MFVDAEPLPGYQEPYGLLCAILQDGTREWRWELDPDLNENAVVWQPYPGAHSIGAILLHIVNTEVFWLEEFALDRTDDPEERRVRLADQIDVDNWQWPEPPRQPISWYFDLHDRVRARTLESIKSWPSPESARDLHGHPRTMRWVLGHVIQHESYHGGQAVLLSRLWAMRKADEGVRAPDQAL
ncbi:DinB family protein [bacterium]|nr:MAG: DinB family protein [bacterium]